jgi:hypothetical protein
VSRTQHWRSLRAGGSGIGIQILPEEDVKDPGSVATAVGMGLGSIAGSLAGIGQAAVNAAVAAGVDVQEASTNDIGGGSQEFPEEEKADTDSTKTTDTDPLSDYIYVPGVGYRRRVKKR